MTDMRTKFTLSYLRTTAWLGNAPNCLEDFDEALYECGQFFDDNEELLKRLKKEKNYLPDEAGMDFYLTRNGHGAGFGDHGLGRDNALYLIKDAKAYGSTNYRPD